MRGIDLGVELGSGVYVFWGGREGSEAFAAKPALDALDRYREAINFLCEYVKDQGYDIKFALEPKPNEPRGDLFLPTVGSALGFIPTLDHPEMVGVNPEVAHETMSGLSFYQAVAQALGAGKLFHIDLNGQKIGRFDQDLRFASEGIKDSFFLVQLSGEVRIFRTAPFRCAPIPGGGRGRGLDFAAGCMRTYLILAEKARQFDQDAEIQAALAQAGAPDLGKPSVGPYSRAGATELLATTFDVDRLASRGYANERLDQLVIDLLLGTR